MSDKFVSSDDQTSVINQEDKHRMFAERFESLTNGFGEACEKHSVPIAIAIAIHPQEELPIIFIRGHQYDVASLLASVLRSMRRDLMSELDIGQSQD